MATISGAEFAKIFFEMRDQRDAATARAEAAEAEVARLRHLVEAVKFDETRMMLARDEVIDEIERLRAALHTIAHSLDTTPGQPPTLEDAQEVASDALAS